MRFRYMSDLHLEFYNNLQKILRHIEWCDDDKDSYLLLAGDIGKIHNNKGEINKLFIELLKYLKDRFLDVIVITGNHEYYDCIHFNKSMSDVDSEYRILCRDLDIKFLQCDSIKIEDVTIHGCTLFTYVSLEDSYDMNDTHQIASREKIINVHETHKNWLKSLPIEGKTIIMTHHVPFRKSVTEHSGYYVDVINDIQTHGNINYWICGHTHNDINKTINNTKVLNCCIGYKGELKKKEVRFFEI